MKRQIALLSIVLLLVLSAPMVAAQPDPGSVGVFFDAAGTTLSKNVAGFAVDFLYVMAYSVGQLTGFEVAVNWTDVSWNILGTTLQPGALNVGTVGNFIVGLGQCVDSGPDFYRMVVYQFGYFAGPVAPSNVMICVGPTTPSSFGTVPGYATCADELVPLQPLDVNPACPPGCGYINIDDPWSPCTIGTEAQSFGALKARF